MIGFCILTLYFVTSQNSLIHSSGCFVACLAFLLEMITLATRVLFPPFLLLRLWFSSAARGTAGASRTHLTGERGASIPAGLLVLGE